MPSTTTIVLLAALLALHFSWRRKLRREQAASRAELARRTQSEHNADAEAQARQNAIFDSMIEGVLVLDENGLVSFANRAFAEMFATVGILRGKALLEIVRSHEIADIAERARAEGRVLDHELKLPGEQERWLQINAAAVTAVDRRRLGMILVFHDLTRLKHLEATRQEFVANVSHELRTPLAMIKGYTETLLGGAKDDPATATKFLQTVERHANRLTLLIEDLLTISSLEAGQIKLDLQPVALSPAVEKVFGDIKPSADAKDMKLLNQLPPLSIPADANRLHQVLSNLVDNAIKYGRAGGSVIVGGRALDDGAVEISVQDDGPGIPVDSLERVFERFYRVDKARSRDQGGTGLGLAIVKHIVQAHGGKVWARSEPGRGSTFLFTLAAGESEIS